MNTILLAAIPLLSTLWLPVLSLPGEKAPSEGDITITILFDNLSEEARLNTGWGFAALLETPEHTILFDTGADGPALLENFRLLGKDPMAVESVVISHAHGDHTGGMKALFDFGVRPRLFLLEAFPAQMLDEAGAQLETIQTAPGQEIVPGIRSTGQVGTEIPEQALILDTRDGTVVLTGCAHPGVILMAERARDLSSQPLSLVMGGFHLMDASAHEIQGILSEFRRLGIRRAGPTHCSGEATMSAFQEAYGDDFQPLGVGRVLKLPLPDGL